MLNHIIIAGRLTKDPEVRYTQNQLPVASFTVACERDYGATGDKMTDFIECVAWRNTAEFVEKYFTKGTMAIVSGRLQIRNWEDNKGVKRKTAEIVADNVYFGESKQRQGDAGAAGNDVPDGYAEVNDDGELPF